MEGCNRPEVASGVPHSFYQLCVGLRVVSARKASVKIDRSWFTPRDLWVPRGGDGTQQHCVSVCSRWRSLYAYSLSNLKDEPISQVRIVASTSSAKSRGCRGGIACTKDVVAQSRSELNRTVIRRFVCAAPSRVEARDVNEILGFRGG